MIPGPTHKEMPSLMNFTASYKTQNSSHSPYFDLDDIAKQLHIGDQICIEIANNQNCPMNMHIIFNRELLRTKHTCIAYMQLKFQLHVHVTCEPNPGYYIHMENVVEHEVIL